VDDPAALKTSAAFSRAVLAFATAFGIAVSGCTAHRKPPSNNYGVERCTKGAEAALLSVDALQCWFVARHGRWRTLSHESHFDVLVVEVEALDLRDSEEIARRFAAQTHDEFSEILVYAHPEPPGEGARVRRVQWTRDKGIEAFDFTGGPGNPASPAK
jgi:hypothetical protein